MFFCAFLFQSKTDIILYCFCQKCVAFMIYSMFLLQVNIRILGTNCSRFLRHCKKYKKYGLLFHLKIVKCIPAILRASLLKFNIINPKFYQNHKSEVEWSRLPGYFVVSIIHIKYWSYRRGILDLLLHPSIE